MVKSRTTGTGQGRAGVEPVLYHCPWAGNQARTRTAGVLGRDGAGCPGCPGCQAHLHLSSAR